MSKILAVFLILINFKVYGLHEDVFFQDKTIGWFWYKDKTLKEKERIKNFLNPEEQVDFEKEQLDRLLKIAIKQPTNQNLINFIKLRNKLIDQSYNFGLRLHQVNLMNPGLDNLDTYPVNQAAKTIYKQQKTQNIALKLAKLSQTHGLFYFFQSNCKHCHVFAPTVKSFANKYNWSVIAVSLDGKAIDEFPDPQPDNGISNRLNVNAVPALIMVEPKTNKVFPIAIGAISEEEIIERIDLLTREIG